MRAISRAGGRAGRRPKFSAAWSRSTARQAGALLPSEV